MVLFQNCTIIITEAGPLTKTKRSTIMNLFIGENIKRLRQKKNITQDKLAEYLCISTQAVSKWERNETYPDITLVIPIASYFGVSTDELLGLDAAKNEQTITEYLQKYNELFATVRIDEADELIRKAYHEFPNDFRIISLYMWNIAGGKADNSNETLLVHKDELSMLCDRVLDECTIDSIRRDALNIQAKLYKAEGDIEKALKVIETFSNWYETKEQKAEQLFEKKSQGWWYWLHRIYTLADFTVDKIEKAVWYSYESFDKKLAHTLRLIEYMKQICKEVGYEFGYRTISIAYGKIANQCAREGRDDEAVEYNEKSLLYAKKFDDFIASDRTISTISNKVKDMAHIESSRVKMRLDWLEATPILENFRERRHFIQLLEKYRPFAK